MKVLLTGFTPFNGEVINPAYEAIKLVSISNATLIKVEIPTVFGKSINQLADILDKEQPDLVILVGQAGGRSSIQLERVAINIDDANIPDNEGQKPVDQPIVANGPTAYFTKLPIKAIHRALTDAEIPCQISNSAGTYVCNHLFYGLMHFINSRYPNMRGGFIHVPYIPVQVLNKPNQPSMNLNDIVKALELIIETTINQGNE